VHSEEKTRQVGGRPKKFLNGLKKRGALSQPHIDVENQSHLGSKESSKGIKGRKRGQRRKDGNEPGTQKPRTEVRQTKTKLAKERKKERKKAKEMEKIRNQEILNQKPVWKRTVKKHSKETTKEGQASSRTNALRRRSKQKRNEGAFNAANRRRSAIKYCRGDLRPELVPPTDKQPKKIV